MGLSLRQKQKNKINSSGGCFSDTKMAKKSRKIENF